MSPRRVAMLSLHTSPMAQPVCPSIQPSIHHPSRMLRLGTPLSAAFIPLVAGLYWARATRQGALAAVVGGLATWIALEVVSPEALVPPQLAGLGASIAGMILGSLLPQRYGRTGTAAPWRLLF